MIENRIVGHGEENPDDILANPFNYRIHPTYQQEAIRDVLDEVGWVKTPIINRVTGHLLDGHLRVMEAIKKGEKSIPVKYVELSEAEEAEALATLDPIALLAQKNAQRAQALADRVATRSNALRGVVESIRPPQTPDPTAPKERLTEKEEKPNENGIISIGEFRIFLPQAEISQWWDEVLARNDGNESKAIVEILTSIGIIPEVNHDK